MTKKYTGQCVCGAVKFEFDKDPEFIANCHCLDCKRASGGEMATFFAVPQEDFTLIADALFRPGTVAMDTVYRPLRTPFLRKAEAAGCVIVSGLDMLLHQGAAQLEWWLGEVIRPEVVEPIMRKALMRVLEDA